MTTSTSGLTKLELVPEIRQAVEKRLGGMKGSILQEIEDLCRRNPADCGNDPIDRLEATSFRQDINWKLKSAQAKLAQIDLAFKRIAENRYGICDSCATPIPIERLQLIPETLFCVACQTKQERRH